MKPYQQGIDYALKIIRPKWNIEIIMLLMDGAKRFNELQTSIEGIRSKPLTDCLRRLETAGIIYRTSFPVVPPKVTYTLTESGKAIEPLLCYLNEWGKEQQRKYEEILKESPVYSLDFM
ncbi:MAG: helix-turn-helix transcriptional regulator [Lachnospiraceae bacterium]|nr:helix-turn-helix transcriptional regulator [Lachnospiraceae bacterium]